MRAKVLPFDLGHAEAPEESVAIWADDLEKELNAWLKSAGSIKIEEVSVIGEHNGALVVFYSDLTTKSKPTLCTQCRKNPPMDNLKVCETCRDYQADYRKKRKEDKKVRYP